MLIPDESQPGGFRTKLLDFGLAKLLSNVAVTMSKTPDHRIMGTPLYMSPEQCQNSARVDEKTDVYSLGIMLYELLAGHPPFSADREILLMSMHLTTKPIPLAEVAPEVPKSLAELVDSMLRKERDERPVIKDVLAKLDALIAAGGLSTARRRASTDALPASTHSSAAYAATLAAGPSMPPLGSVAMRSQARKRNLALAAGGGLLLLGLGFGARYYASAPQTASGTLSQPPPAPIPQTVTWKITSTPPGAALATTTGEVLGKTPLQLQRPLAPGPVKLVLRLPGYQDHELTLSQDRDQTASETLVVLPTPPPETSVASAPSRSRGKKRGSAAERAEAPAATAAATAPAKPVKDVAKTEIFE